MKKVKRPSARQRLLTAAAKVFARDGLIGATTRAIAKEAGVNEVTLFRLFGNKDSLVSEVVGLTFPETESEEMPIPVSTDLRADLIGYAALYSKRLKDNLALVRTMLGEIHHNHASHEREVFRGIFRPIKAALVTRLRKAHADGQIDRSWSVEILADFFNAMIFTDTLRRSTSPACPEYSFETAMKTAVALILGPAPGRARKE